MPVLSEGKANNDYGRGFYCTEDVEMAREWACKGTMSPGFVNAYDLELNSKARDRELAQWMAKERLVSFVGSDMHGLPPKQAPRMKEGLDWLYGHTDEAYADAAAFGNAEELFGLKEE